jgi:hypothetical protein
MRGAGEVDITSASLLGPRLAQAHNASERIPTSKDQGQSAWAHTIAPLGAGRTYAAERDTSVDDIWILADTIIIVCGDVNGE